MSSDNNDELNRKRKRIAQEIEILQYLAITEKSFFNSPAINYLLLAEALKNDLSGIPLQVEKRKYARKTPEESEQRVPWSAYVEKTDDLLFYKDFRMSKAAFAELFELLRADHGFEKKNAMCRRQDVTSIDAEYVLATVLHKLGGGKFSSLAQIFKISESQLYVMFLQGLDIILRNEALFLDNDCLVKGENHERFSTGFNQLTWKGTTMQGCVGALDGVTFACVKPDHPKQKLFVTRKGGFAMSYQAVVDSKMNFTFVSEPVLGSTHDMNAFRLTHLYQAIYRNKVLGEKFWLAADSAYELSDQVQTPYSRPAQGKRLSNRQKAYNEKLSSLRVRVEIAFGMLKKKFKILSNIIEYSNTRICGKIIRSCFLLHNFCRSFKSRIGTSGIDEEDMVNETPLQEVEGGARQCDNPGKSTRRTILTEELFEKGYRHVPGQNKK